MPTTINNECFTLPKKDTIQIESEIGFLFQLQQTKLQLQLKQKHHSNGSSQLTDS